MAWNRALVAASGLIVAVGLGLPAIAIDIDLKEELLDYNQVLTYKDREPRVVMQKMDKSLQPKKKVVSEKEIEDARERVLTLKAYLDEIER